MFASAEVGRSGAAPGTNAASCTRQHQTKAASCIVPLHLSCEMMWSKDGLLASLLSQHCSNSCSNSGWQIRRAPGSWSAGGTVGRFCLSTTSMTTCSRQHRPQPTAQLLQDDTTQASMQSRPHHNSVEPCAGCSMPVLPNSEYSGVSGADWQTGQGPTVLRQAHLWCRLTDM